MATRVRLDDHGPAAFVVCGEDGVWSVLEGGYDSDLLEQYLNLLWGPNWTKPHGKFNPYPSFLRVEQLLEAHKGEILGTEFPAPTNPEAIY